MTRGDVVELKPPRRPRGSEQRGRRFGVVLQSDRLAKLSTTIVAPTSTAAAEAPFHVPVQVRGRETLVMVEQLRSADHGRVGRRVARLEPAEIGRVDEALRLVFGLM